ncbi:MAG: 50S ribosomal protein L5, partial [Burkholderiales bacterium]
MAKEKNPKSDKPAKGEGRPAPVPAPAQAERPAKAARAEAKSADKPAKPSRPALPVPPARLASYYREKVVPELVSKFGYKTTMQVPRIRKITINMGVGEAVGDKKTLDNAVADMAKIAGQKPVVTKARRSIANFKLRAGYPIGCMVTLRGARMYEFLD